MFTILGFSLGFLALGAVVAVLNVLATVFMIAFTLYAALALIGVIVFSVIGIRRVMARRRVAQGQPVVRNSTPAQVVSHQAGDYR